MKKQHTRLSAGILGYTDDGIPIVTPTYNCDFFVGEENCLCFVRECWYCKYADFRKCISATMSQSTCHCCANKIQLRKDGFYGF